MVWRVFPSFVQVLIVAVGQNEIIQSYLTSLASGTSQSAPAFQKLNQTRKAVCANCLSLNAKIKGLYGRLMWPCVSLKRTTAQEALGVGPVRGHPSSYYSTWPRSEVSAVDVGRQ